MSYAIDDIEISKKRGRPATGATPVMVRIDPQDIENIDNWRSNRRPIPSRPEAIRQLAKIGLGSHPIVRELLEYLETLPPGPELDSTIEKLRGILG